MAAMTAIGPARGVTLQAARLPLRVRLGGIRRQPGPSHALDRAVFVLVRRVAADADGADGGAARVQDEHRSEEHTSELQSQSNLVCRLLLEKKKNKAYTPAAQYTPK